MTRLSEIKKSWRLGHHQQVPTRLEEELACGSSPSGVKLQEKEKTAQSNAAYRARRFFIGISPEAKAGDTPEDNTTPRALSPRVPKPFATFR
jgi:hypothetical protein